MNTESTPLTASSLPHFHVIAERRLGGKLRKMYIRWASDCSLGGHILATVHPERSYTEKHALALLSVSSREFPEWGLSLGAADS